MSLKPQNIIGAAQADIVRRSRNAIEAEHEAPAYETYAFHRAHVRRARDVKALLVLALMHPEPGRESGKRNTKMIYRNAGLLLAALRSLP